MKLAYRWAGRANPAWDAGRPFRPGGADRPLDAGRAGWASRALEPDRASGASCAIAASRTRRALCPLIARGPRQARGTDGSDWASGALFAARAPIPRGPF